MDRVSDEWILSELRRLYSLGYTEMNINVNVLLELQERREAERKDTLSQALNEGDGVYRP